MGDSVRMSAGELAARIMFRPAKPAEHEACER